MPTNSKLSLDSWAAIYQAQISRYQTVFSADHNIDTKAGVVLGATFVVAAFVISKELFLIENKYVFSLLVVGCLLYILTIVLLLIHVLHPKDYVLPSNTTKEHPEYLGKKDDDLMYQLVVDIEDATSRIESNLRKKAALLSISSISFSIGTLILIAVKML